MLPRVDAATRTEWLVYDAPPLGEYGAALAALALYIVLLTAAGLFDFHRRERMTRAVPAWILRAARRKPGRAGRPGTRALGPPRLADEELPPAPSARALRLAAFGETQAAARLGMLYLQAFDLHALDYARLAAWLRALLELDPRGQYPLFAAARIYAEHPDPARSRVMLELIHEQFLLDPDRRWPWLAHAALLAKHRLKDLPLARRYAAAIDRHTTAADVPLWARQMEIFILEDMNELEAARIMLGGLLASGRITDPAELELPQAAAAGARVRASARCRRCRRDLSAFRRSGGLDVS